MWENKTAHFFFNWRCRSEYVEELGKEGKEQKVQRHCTPQSTYQEK